MEKLILKEPAPYSQLIKFSLQVYRRSFNKVLFLSLLLAIVIFLPAIIADLTNHEVFFMDSFFDPRRLWLILVDLFSLIVLVAIIWNIHCVMFGIKEPLIQDFKMGLQKLAQVLLAVLIQVILIFAAIFIVYGFETVLFQPRPMVHPGFWGIAFVGLIFGLQIAFILYVSTLFVFYIPIIATENKGIIVALERSISLVWNHWWRTLSVQLTPWFYYTMILIVMKYVLGLNIHFYFTERKIYTLQITILHLVLFTFFIPWITSLLLVQLNDLELRKKLKTKHAE